MLNTEVSLIRQHQETANNEMGKLDHEHVFEREFWQKDREIRESQQDLALRMAQYIQRKPALELIVKLSTVTKD
jgi:hypothetical protein